MTSAEKSSTTAEFYSDELTLGLLSTPTVVGLNGGPPPMRASTIQRYLCGELKVVLALLN